MFYRSSILTLAFGVIASLSLPSLAGVEEFNAAMARGDYKAAAAETKAVWESFDKTKPAAATVAREFAFVSVLAEQNEQAREFIRPLLDSTNPVAANDDQPAVSRVIAALIELRIGGTKENRAQLVSSLERRAELEGVDNISLVAAEMLYSHDWSVQELGNTNESAQLAVTLLNRAGESAVARLRKAELVVILSSFLRNKHSMHYDSLVDLHDSIVSDVDSTAHAGVREALIPLKWMAHAWVKAVEALFTSHYSQLGSHVDKNISPRELARSKNGHFHELAYTTDPRPFCDVELNDGKLRYPTSAAFRGMVGSVLVKLDFDEKGRASNPSVLAAVPVAQFADNVLKAAPTFRLEPKSGVDPKTCSLGRKDAVIPITFVIQ